MKNKILKLLLGPVFGHGITFILTPFFMSKYTPNIFGDYAFFISLIGLFLAISCLRFEAICLVCRDKELNNIINLSLLSIVFVSLIIFIITFLVRYKFSFYLSIAIFSQAIQVFISNLLLRNNKHYQASIIRFIFISSIPILQLILAIYDYPEGLIVGYFLSSILLSILCLIYLIVLKRGLRKNINLYKYIFKKYKSYYTTNSISSLINSFSSQILPISIQFLFGSYVLGLINIMQRLFINPSNFILRIIMQVYNKEFSEKLRKKKLNLASSLFYKTSIYCFVINIIIFSFIYFFITFALTAFNNEAMNNWIELKIYLPPILLLCIVQGAVIPVSQSLTYLEKHKYQLYFETIKLFVLISLIILSKYMNYSSTIYIYCY
ncbi:lipopolysaccharide biosynthesis protein, partial [Proteus faecis]|uniref:lipopolysaccharide biosynthesis protein n=1 Tax=Proteus faecis TaxID=2050967 RepID=UPI001F215C66